MLLMRTLIGLAALTVAACAGVDAQLPAAATPPAAAAAAAPIAGDWVQVQATPARIDGRRYTPTCSDVPGADPAYSFWFRQGASNNLVVFFDGGGACWDDLTCSVPWLATGRADDGLYKAEILPTDNPNRFGGMFALDDPRNPVRDWSFVFIPYCTGDVHLGSNTARYRNIDTGEAFSVQHRGADNVRAVLDWVHRNVAAPQQLLVAGSSAGAYGAVGHYESIRNTYPRARATFLGDAGQGVTTPEFLEVRRQQWGSSDAASADAVAQLAARYPNDRFGQFTTAQDRTQSAFYALMGVDNACSAWPEKMVRELGARQSAPNFRSYMAAGVAHTVLRAPGFYTETSGGEAFVDWFAALLRAGGSNRACANCLVPPRGCAY